MSDLSENPYAATEASSLTGTRQPLLVTILRVSYVLLWLVVFADSLLRNSGYVSIAENKSIYDGLWTLASLASLGIYLYMYHSTLSRLLLAHILLWAIHAVFIFSMIVGAHDILPPQFLYSATNMLWPIVIWRLRSANRVQRLLLRMTAIISAVYLVLLAITDIAEPSILFTLAFVGAYGLYLLSRAIVLMPYSFPDRYSDRDTWSRTGIGST